MRGRLQLASLTALILGVLLVTACGGSDPAPTATPVAPATSTPTPTATPEPTPQATSGPAATLEPTATSAPPPPEPTPAATTGAPVVLPTATAEPVPTPTATTAPPPAPVPTPTAVPPTATATPADVPGGPVTVTLSPSHDTTIFEESGDIGNGSGQHLFVGNTNGGVARRVLVQFDIVGTVPTGAQIASVALAMLVNRTRADTMTVSLFRLLAGWGEGPADAIGQEGRGAAAQTNDATWTLRSKGGESWSQAGGDFATERSAFASVNSGGANWNSTAEMVSDVQGWLDDPSSNVGWIAVGDESEDQTAKRFGSREGSFGPSLTITYEMVAG